MLTNFIAGVWLRNPVEIREGEPIEWSLIRRIGQLESEVAKNTWQPIETAPRDGTKILVGMNIATVWVVHIAWWCSVDDCPEFTEEDEGWWSYTRGSVTQEQLDGYRTPTHWKAIDFPLEPMG